jgi:NAD(P)-dependent dehydrogenase (short-subunit alcohol dehydrogenase family)
MPISYDFSGKTALVTGGGSGIGEAVVGLFATGGAKVVVADRDAAHGEAVVEALVAKGLDATFHAVDVTDPAAVEAMVAFTVSTYGSLDIAVNNAGIGGEGLPIGESDLKRWKRIIDVNLNGVFYGLRYEIPAMLAGNGGAIVNMSSILGSVANQGSPAYVSSKHAVVGMTKAAALEYSSKGVRVNSVGPGYINTPLVAANLDETARAGLAALHATGRLGEAIEVAHLVAFLCSDEASFITGSYHKVDGGFSAR